MPSEKHMNRGKGERNAASVRSAVREAISSNKLRWCFALIAAQLAPLMEVAFVSCLYLLIDPDWRSSAFLTFLQQHVPNLGLAAWTEFARLTCISLTALFLLLAGVCLRYANEANLAGLLFNSYLQDSQALVLKYLYAPTATARRVGKDRITSSILLDCGLSAYIAHHILYVSGLLFSMAAYMAVGALLSWRLLLVVTAVYGLPLLVSRRLYGRLQAVGKSKVRTEERILGYFTDMLSGFERSRLDGLETSLQDKAGRLLQKGRKWRVRKKMTRAMLRVLTVGIPLLCTLVVVYLATAVLSVKLAVLAALLVIFARVRSCVTEVSGLYAAMRQNLPHVHRYTTLVQELEAGIRTPVLRDPPAISPVKVEMQEVSFRYDEETVLDAVDIQARAGDRILICGPSGHGKSTMLEVLCGLLPPSSGQVLYDGKPLDEKLFYEVRPMIAYVSPTVYLFNDTLRNNLLMGHPEKEEELEKAIQLSGLEDVVAELPNGLDSPLGTDGNALSLGQRQRVILARLFLRKPRLILLDEATANLDPKLEATVMGNLLSFIDPEAILIMVAHKAPAGIEFNKKFILQDGHLMPCEVMPS